MSCKNDAICKHFVLTSFTECLRQDICKFHDSAEVIRSHDDHATQVLRKKHMKKSPGRPPKYASQGESSVIDGGITKKEFKKALAKVHQLKFNKKLDENQLKALEPMKGKRFGSLTEAQKQQIINIAKT